MYYELGDVNAAIADFNLARSVQERGVEKLIDRDETGFYAEGLALYHTGQQESAYVMLNLAILTAKRFNNPRFQTQISAFIDRYY